MMQGDPKRPYAQLLTPAAKSQKMLLRLQHKKLLSSSELGRAQTTFAVWQKLLAKNIPSTPWPCFADLLLFPEEEYIALSFYPFERREEVKAAMGFRHLHGYILLDQRQEAALLALDEDHLIISSRLVDRIGSRAWLAASRDLADWQSSLVDTISPATEDAALDLLGLLRQQADAPWANLGLSGALLEPVQCVYFALWRARGRAVSAERLLLLRGEAMQALQWMQQASLVEMIGESYRLR